MSIFLNQALDMTLICKDEDGDIVDLSGKTMLFIYQGPDGVETTDNSPTVDSTAGSVAHSFTTTELSSTGYWRAVAKVDVDDIPSEYYRWPVYGPWAVGRTG